MNWSIMHILHFKPKSALFSLKVWSKKKKKKQYSIVIISVLCKSILENNKDFLA